MNKTVFLFFIKLLKEKNNAVINKFKLIASKLSVENQIIVFELYDLFDIKT